jgi:hypothetical protein
MLRQALCNARPILNDSQGLSLLLLHITWAQVQLWNRSPRSPTGLWRTTPSWSLHPTAEKPHAQELVVAAASVAGGGWMGRTAL